ncbi:hypothetical protein D3227_29935 [Mesorhizobium waimense]|uniref:Uncharacterized protein n=1 Tax=Mesorhizobium waimense TaxID=1300307 RepID=A0A3A5K5T9_9HYPH|nr:hypothetical protein [Mesorhizobium waimense]RJT30821.1 hypothetical protein D3227_29935 [Mesorhizobium waimense]
MRRAEIEDDLKELAFDFLYYFARFDFALKVNGYLKIPMPVSPQRQGGNCFVSDGRVTIGFQNQPPR